VPDESVKPEMTNERDQALGMGAKITRRDFLNGVALTVGAAAIPPEMWAAAAADLEAQDAPGYYPPPRLACAEAMSGRSRPCTRSATAIFGRALPSPSIR